MRDALLDTKLAVTFLVREGVTPEQAQRCIYRWSIEAKITNYGGIRRNQAKWKLSELVAACKSAGIGSDYNRAHQLVYAERGHPSERPCEDCGVDPAEEWAHLDGPGWTLDPTRYAALCVRCHRLYDENLRKGLAPRRTSNVT